MDLWHGLFILSEPGWDKLFLKKVSLKFLFVAGILYISTVIKDKAYES